MRLRGYFSKSHFDIVLVHVFQFYSWFAVTWLYSNSYLWIGKCMYSSSCLRFYLFLLKGRVVAQAFTHQPVTAEAVSNTD